VSTIVQSVQSIQSIPSSRLPVGLGPGPGILVFTVLSVSLLGRLSLLLLDQIQFPTQSFHRPPVFVILFSTNQPSNLPSHAFQPASLSRTSHARLPSFLHHHPLRLVLPLVLYQQNKIHRRIHQLINSLCPHVSPIRSVASSNYTFGRLPEPVALSPTIFPSPLQINKSCPTLHNLTSPSWLLALSTFSNLPPISDLPRS
jgi:hypothetical protein